MLKSAACVHCDHDIPIGPSIEEFRLAPQVVVCPGCKRSVDTIFPFRVRWSERLVVKFLVPVLVPLGGWLAYRSDSALWLRILIGFGVCIVAPWVLSRTLAFPVAMVADKITKR